MAVFKKLMTQITEFTVKRNTWFKFSGAIFPGIGAVLLVFLRDSLLAGKLTFAVISYIALLFIWVIVYYIFIINENNTNKKNIQENKESLTKIKDDLDNSISNAPSSTFIKESLTISNSIYDIIQGVNFKRKTLAISLEDYETEIDKILTKICRLTQLFSKKDDATYTANLMFYIKSNEANLKHIEEIMDEKHKDGFIYNREFRPQFIKFILESVTPQTAGKIESSNYIPTYLAVGIENDIEIQVPGAPDAADKAMAIVNSTAFAKEEDLNQFDEKVKIKARNYFNIRGNKVKSLLSIKIPNPALPDKTAKEQKILPIIGVLNIDCNKEYPLGGEIRFAFTYLMVVEPILRQFAELLVHYFQVHPEINGIDNSK